MLPIEDDLVTQRMLTPVGLALLVWFTASDNNCQAAVLTYSWSGHILPSGDADPWSLGPVGQPFELSGSIQASAGDMMGLNTELAAFAVSSVNLAINGVTIEYLGGGAFDFTDNHEGQLDIVAFDGLFSVSGQALEVGTAVSLPADTFAFSSLVEPPPLFAATLSSAHTTYAPGPYTGVVVEGTSVRVVPEPSIGALLSGIVIFCALKQRMRKGGKSATTWRNLISIPSRTLVMGKLPYHATLVG
ncbi:MAG TPA: hypothetical protein VEQ85_04280 [Lacipirellulaceae bacterium]|nr:hypothetical protein [Lacipirellulaceae bacterium]